MNVSEQELRERYRDLQTEQLLELQARGTLTETATRILQQELGERSFSVEQRLEVEKRLGDMAANTIVVRADRRLGRLPKPQPV